MTVQPEFIQRALTENDLPKTGFKQFTEKVVGAEEPISFERPMGVVSDGAGKAYIADPASQNVVVYDFNANTVHLFGKNVAEDLFKEPMGLAMDSAGNLYVSDAAAKRIHVFSPDEKVLRGMALTAETVRPVGIAIDKERKRLIVADSRGHKVDVYDLTGKHLFKIGKPGGGDGEFTRTGEIAADERAAPLGRGPGCGIWSEQYPLSARSWVGGCPACALIASTIGRACFLSLASCVTACATIS